MYLAEKKKSKWISICKIKSSDGSKGRHAVLQLGVGSHRLPLLAGCFMCFLLGGVFFPSTLGIRVVCFPSWKWYSAVVV